MPDFQLGRTTCALYLRCVAVQLLRRPDVDVDLEDSLKYHRLHPEYIHQRIQKLGNAYNLRILLLMCDVVRTGQYLRTIRLPHEIAERTPRPDS